MEHGKASPPGHIIGTIPGKFTIYDKKMARTMTVCDKIKQGKSDSTKKPKTLQGDAWTHEFYCNVAPSNHHTQQWPSGMYGG